MAGDLSPVNPTLDDAGCDLGLKHFNFPQLERDLAPYLRAARY
jgi:hypothetical protein